MEPNSLQIKNKDLKKYFDYLKKENLILKFPGEIGFIECTQKQKIPLALGGMWETPI